MVKKITLKALSFGFFGISMIFSAMLLTSQAYDGVNFALLLVQAILIDSFKMTSLVISTHLLNLKKYLLSIIFTIVFVFLFIISIAASLGYLYNTNLKSTSIDSQNSSGYARNEDMYINKQKEIESLKELLEGTESSYNETINSLPSDYITRKSELTQEKQQELNNIQAKIDQANKDLAAINSNFATLENAETSISGYNALFTQVAKFMNESRFAETGKQYTAKDISFYFFAMVSIIFEISAVLCWYQSNMSNSDISIFEKNKNSNSKTTLFGKPKEIKQSKNEDNLSMKAEIANIENTPEYSLYIKKMLENTTTDEHNGAYRTIGYKKIGDMAGLNSSEALQIYHYLKEINSVKVEALRTYLNSDELINEYEENYKKRKIGFLQAD